MIPVILESLFNSISNDIVSLKRYAREFINDKSQTLEERFDVWYNYIAPYGDYDCWFGGPVGFDRELIGYDGKLLHAERYENIDYVQIIDMFMDKCADESTIDDVKDIDYFDDYNGKRYKLGITITFGELVEWIIAKDNKGFKYDW